MRHINDDVRLFGLLRDVGIWDSHGRTGWGPERAEPREDYALLDHLGFSR